MSDDALNLLLPEIFSLKEGLGKIAGRVEAQQEIIDKVSESTKGIVSDVAKMGAQIDGLKDRMEARERTPEIKVDATTKIGGSVGGHVGKENVGDVK